MTLRQYLLIVSASLLMADTYLILSHVEAWPRYLKFGMRLQWYSDMAFTALLWPVFVVMLAVTWVGVP